LYFCRFLKGQKVPLHLTSMIFTRFKNSLLGAVLIFVFLFTGSRLVPGLAQEDYSVNQEAYLQVYQSAQEALKHDPLIQNGVFYSYPYYNALGHPFLDIKEFVSGSVNFRGKQYEGLSINYDLFNQQIILSWEIDGILQMCLLEPHFISAFELKGKRFEKLDYQDGAAEFFQLVSEGPAVSCYYSWYKERREVHDSGNRSIYSFSDQKSRRYLLMEGRLSRYKSNKSFIRIFPEAARSQLKSHFQDKQIQVMESGEGDMGELIAFCNRVLDQMAKQGAE